MVDAFDFLGMAKQRRVLALRKELHVLHQQALSRISVSARMKETMTIVNETLHIRQHRFDLTRKRRIVIVAIGKASIPMSCHIADILAPLMARNLSVQGILVGPNATYRPPAGLVYFQGGHPLPNAASLAAAEAVISLLHTVESSDLVLFLISGGASAMIEAPLDASFGVEEIESFYRELVHSGLSVTEINTLRKHFSAIKGGRLAARAVRGEQCTVLISDVPGEAYDMVGSGPSLPDSSTVADCRSIIKSSVLQQVFSPRVLGFFESQLPETPSVSDPAFVRASWVCLLSNDELLEEIRRLADAVGFHAEIDTSCDDWDYRCAAKYLLDRLRILSKSHERVCLISGGELSVQVSGPSGRGGRNQQFALELALHLQMNDPAIALLSAGSDGVDGNSPAAGAIADSFTVTRSHALGLDPAWYRDQFDSYTFFQKLDDAITTGPSGNNVRDLRILLSTQKP